MPGKKGANWLPVALTLGAILALSLSLNVPSASGGSPRSLPDVREVTPLLYVNVTAPPGQSNVTAEGDQMFWLTQVESNGLPVSGASLSFGDQLGAGFSTATTNATGWALVTMSVQTTHYGPDLVTAYASDAGYTSGSGSYPVSVLPQSSSQLSITGSVQPGEANGGSSAIVSGWVYQDVSYPAGLGPAVAGMTVTLNDSLGATFVLRQVSTDPTGHFSANFSVPDTRWSELDFLTAAASGPGLKGSSSTTYMTVTPDLGNALSVTLNRSYPSPGGTTADGDQMVWLAQVEARGRAVAGANVVFSDYGQSSFTNATTNQTGWAVSSMRVTEYYAGWDWVTATASKNGYTTSNGSNEIGILGRFSGQLTIVESVENATPRSGDVDVVSGWVYGNGPLGSHGPGVPNATVIFNDPLGSKFLPSPSVTGSSGQFRANFTVGDTRGPVLDVLTATASGSGLDGSSSAIYLALGAPDTYGVTFAENGLPSGLPWSITLAGTTQSSIQNTTTFREPNGTDAFKVGSEPGWTTAEFAGSVTVSGDLVLKPVSWTRVTYGITFSETGLPPGNGWSITLGNSSQSGVGNLSVTGLANGTYRYNVVAVDEYDANRSTGTIVVAGANVTELVTFTEVPVVGPPPPSPGPPMPTLFGLPIGEAYLVLAGIGCGGGVGGLLLALRARRLKNPPH